MPVREIFKKFHGFSGELLKFNFVTNNGRDHNDSDSSGKNYTQKKVYEKGKRGDITGSARRQAQPSSGQFTGATNKRDRS
ncbi:hypothetical protein, partial [Mucilaginibacter sp.]|uniref:hypothetical protein n=1 Tax=Mucilaginibacter sp. TaxID=1882438 RepID=UPI002ED49D4C